VIAEVAVLSKAATECYNPMCADYHLAQDAIATLLGTLGAVGVLGFLTEAVTNPEGFGKQVATYSDQVGDAAIAALGGILHVSIRQVEEL
jgi:hypothetical protein